LTVTGFGQACSDLFISELVFGPTVVPLDQPSDSNSERSLSINHAIEIYNPTDDTIDLSNYKIQLVTEDTLITEVDLSGDIFPYKTFVVTNTLSDSLIQDKADLFDQDFNLTGNVLLQILKGRNTIDVIGRLDIADDVGTLTLEDLLSNPSYLQEININLSSLQDLIARRRPIVQQGATTFETSELLGEWRVYPNEFIDDLGDHVCACKSGTARVNWDNVNFSEPELTSDETEEVDIIATLVVTGLEEDEFVELSFNDTFHEYDEPEAEDATTFVDFEFDIFQTVILTEEEPSLDVTLGKIIDDNENECEEGKGFTFNIVGGTLNVTAGFDYLWDMLIIDDECINSTTKEQQIINNYLSIYPSVISDYTNIELLSPSIDLKSVAITDLQGRVLRNIPFDELSIHNRLDLSFLQNQGYYVLLFKTNKGLIAKRIIKQ